jgi:hypothetical protein
MAKERVVSSSWIADSCRVDGSTYWFAVLVGLLPGTVASIYRLPVDVYDLGCATW